MEELIWKYLDKTCSPEENDKVINLLKTDADFKMSFESISELENQLMLSAEIPMSQTFQIKLEQLISKELALNKQSGIVHILPVNWVIALSLIAGAIILYSINLSQNTEPLLSFLPTLDEKIISMIGLVSVSFILLILIDVFMNRMHDLKKITHILA